MFQSQDAVAAERFMAKLLPELVFRPRAANRAGVQRRAAKGLIRCFFGALLD